MGKPYLFLSTDPGLPSLLGNTAGSLINVVKACLVDGGTTQSITSITRSGVLATATKTSHGFHDGAVITHAGADQAAYNGTFRIKVTGVDTYTFRVEGAPATPATGSITAKMAAAGWSQVTHNEGATNIAAFKAGAGKQACIQIIDDGSTATYTTRVAQIFGFTSMTDDITGAGQFNGSALYVGKATVNDATPRKWMILADDKRFILMVGTVSGYPDAYANFCFGDLCGTQAETAYAIISGATAASAAANTSAGSSAANGNLVFATGSTHAFGDWGSGSLVSFGTTSTGGSGSGSFANPLSVVWADRPEFHYGTTNTAEPIGYFPGILYNRNNLDAGTYGHLYAIDDYRVVRYTSINARSYLLDLGAWE